MSIIWADFPSGQQGIYGTDVNKMLNGIWAQIVIPASHNGTVTLVSDPDPGIGASGTVLRTTRGGAVAGAVGARFALPTPTATQGAGFRLWLSSLPNDNVSCPFFVFRNNGNSDIIAVRVLSTGAIEARSTLTSSGTLYGETSGPVVVANAYNHIEIKATADIASGAIEVRVNGVTVLNLTDLNTGSSNIAQIFFGYHNNSTNAPGLTAWWKDLILWNTNGTVGNNFQGSVAVRDLYPDADISLNWATSTGATGWNLIDETNANDADYIQAGDPPPSPYVASLTDLPEDVTSVRALLPIYRAIKTDGGDCNIQVGLTPNNTDWDNGADRPLTTAYTYWWDVSEVSPATSSSWTPIEVNNAYVRANRTL